MTDCKKLIDEIITAPCVPRWTMTAVSKSLGVSTTTVSNVYRGVIKDPKSSFVDGLRALHKRVTKAQK